MTLEKKRIVHSTEQQARSGTPTNFLGRPPRGIRRLEKDASYEYTGDPGHQELYLMSDGVLGEINELSMLDYYHFDAAHNDYLQLETLRRFHDDVEQEVKRLLREASMAKKDQIKNDQTEDAIYTSRAEIYTSPELDDPDMFTLDRMDWDVWQEFVKPFVERKKLREYPSLGLDAVTAALAHRPIRYPGEVRNDDMTIVSTQLSGS